MKPAGYYDNNYQYDGSLDTTTVYFKYNDDLKTANIFTVGGMNQCESQLLKAVSFFIPTNTNLQYHIDVYRDLQNPKDPTSGTKIEDDAFDGFTTLGGLYTVELLNPVELSRGEQFSVVVTLIVILAILLVVVRLVGLQVFTIILKIKFVLHSELEHIFLTIQALAL